MKPLQYIMMSAALAAVSSSGATASVTGPSSDWSRYQVILDRAPFGRVPQPGDSDYVDPAAAAAAAAAVPEGPAISEAVKITMISIFDGRPAVGFVDNNTKKSYYLFEGDEVDGYEIVSVAPAESSACIRKDGKEETLRVGGAAAPQTSSSATATSLPSAVPAPAPTIRTFKATPSRSRQKSYSDLQREREEIRKKMEEQRRKDEEERQKEKQTGEELKKNLREYNLDLIRAGRRPPVSFELTAEEAKQLADEGFDVSSGSD